ncbi:hypothetical protein ATW55_11185 [Ferroacidibacillus organovorans]|uniref:Translation initiation factor IF-2 N-terminal domain-containing protein n=1 Tax=Ferroacidibacillus organovorans TaxID=1765683 RepID=A0A101XP86_9BACL|nr:hypothetical protein ATW55_11185 [Ferroacidibacillus organovorans]
MTKLRVYEYAKQLNMSSKEIITILGRLNMPVNNHMSVMEPGMVSAVESFFSDVKARAATKTAAEQQRILAQEAARKKQLLEQSSSEGEASITGNGLNEKDGNERKANGAVLAPFRKDDEHQSANLERSSSVTFEQEQPPVAREPIAEAPMGQASRDDSSITGARSTQLQAGARSDRNGGATARQGRVQGQGSRDRYGDRSYEERTARATNAVQDGAAVTAVEQSQAPNGNPRSKNRRVVQSYEVKRD